MSCLPIRWEHSGDVSQWHCCSTLGYKVLVLTGSCVRAFNIGQGITVRITTRIRRLGTTVRFLSCLLLLFAAEAPVAALEPLTITRITPSGDDVPPGQQILIEFSRAVVPLGRMEREASEVPVTITPALHCHWRWITRQALACNLEDQDRLAVATRYTLTADAGLTAMDGATLVRPVTRHFVTQRPMVTRVNFKNWLHPGVPVLRVVFNQAVSRTSVEEHFTLLAAQHSSPIAVSVSPDPDERSLPRYHRLPGKKWLLDAGVQAEQGSDEQPVVTAKGEPARRIWLLQPDRPLPLDSQVQLAQGAGLESAQGAEPGVARSGVIEFHTYPAFRFLGVRCQTNDEERVLLPPRAAKAAPSGRCDPLRGFALAFSAPVLKSALRRSLAFEPGLGGAKAVEPWANQRDYSRLQQPHRQGASYDYWLQGALQADQHYRVSLRQSEEKDGVAPSTVALHDEFGRALQAGLDIGFHTDHRRPDFNLVHHDAVLESAVDSEPPLYVTNLDQATLSYRRLDQQGEQAGLTHTLTPAPVPDIAFAIPLSVRELLEGRSGAVFGSIGADPAVARKSYHDRRFFAQVTPYQVHAKVGHFNTLIWVTDLTTGEAVSGARVSIYRDKLSRLGPVPAESVAVITDEHGTAELPGTRVLDPALGTLGWQCNGDDCERLLVRVDGDQGMALLPLNSSFRVNAYRVSAYKVFLDQRQQYGHISSWGLTAQGVYRAGDTIQYKLYVRDHDNRRLRAAPLQSYTLELVDPTGKVVHERKGLSLNAFGALQGDYRLPESSVMGWYEFQLKADFTDYQWQPMRVLVSDFTPAPFRVTNDLNGDLYRLGDTLVTRTRAALYSGGAYTQAEARVTVNLSAATFRSSDPLAKDFQFDTATETRWLQLHQSVAELDGEGAAEDRLALQASDILYGRLAVESAVRDDRGQYIAAAAAADYIAIDRLVGLRKKQWVFNVGESAAIDYLVVDEQGQPVADTPVDMAIERLETKAARVKGAGNAYITRYNEQWKPFASCHGQPQKAPLSCAFVPDTSGRYRIVASVLDSRGQRQATTLSAWVVGSGQAVWREDAGYALAMEPEQASYLAGDTARFLIKNPFPGATALVTLERYGVIRQWQQRLEGSTPVVEFPVAADYVPGVYLSVVVMSPRVADPPASASQGSTALDLGKPTFRMGYAAVPVTDPHKQLAVTASTDQPSYKPRDTVRVQLQAQAQPMAPALANQGDSEGQEQRGSEGAEPIEYAVVVLDEAVFDLIAAGRDYFDPYRGFYRLDGLDVDNYSLLSRIVGRHRFEKKGASSGGDGGQGLSLRSLFEFVSYWNPSLVADEQGRASFEFELPDNLTGWRVLALAVTPGDRFGLGDVNFKTSQPTQLQPVMPNQVSEGDTFAAGFSVMNRTAEPRTLQVSVAVEGDAEPVAALHTTLKLDAFQRETVSVPMAAALALDRQRRTGNIVLRARAWDQDDGDALVHSLPVLKRRQLEVVADYGSLPTDGSLPANGSLSPDGSSPPTDGSLSPQGPGAADRVTLPLLIPSSIYTDIGDLSVQLAASVIGNVDGAFRFMRDYDHSCWEQILSRGVMASHFTVLEPRLASDLTWPGSDTLPAELLQRAANYQAPNGGMSFFIARDSHVSPYLSAYTALAFSWLRASGYAIPTRVDAALQAYLLRLLRRDELPGFYSRGMAATVRAVALNALAASGAVAVEDIRRHARHLSYMDLFGAANLLAAAQQITGADDVVIVARDRLLSHASVTSGKLTFNEEIDDGYSRLLATPLRTQCAILSALAADDSPQPLGSSAASVAGPAAIVRAITQTRGSRDHWENTQENIFCMNALVDYARRWEADTPALQASVQLDDQVLGRGHFTAYDDPPVDIVRPLSATDPGSEQSLMIQRQGQGRLYYTTRLAYAPLAVPAARVNAGMEVRREYSVQRDGQWTLLEEQAQVERGELLRVDLFVNLPSARNFVVVDDPVAGGLEPVNRDLATASGVDAREGDYQPAGGSWWFRWGDWVSYGASRWSFYHREVRHDAVRFYADYLPPGRYHLAYTAQAIATGRFGVAPAVASEMYDSDVYGKSRPMTLEVEARR